MKGVYISDCLDSCSENCKTGVGNKIQGQIKAFSAAGLVCSNYSVQTHEENKWGKIRKRLCILGDGLNWKLTDEISQADFLYIRKPNLISREFIGFLKKVRISNPSCKIILEIPTYPYDEEYKRYWHRLPLLWQDRHWRKKLCLYVDRIARLTDEEVIWDIPTIPISNGIDLSTYRIKHQNQTDTFNIGCAAQFEFSHGIDRMLYGLSAYQKEEHGQKVHLYLAGDGPQLGELKRLTESLGIQNLVTFTGRLNRQGLYDKIYDWCDIAIDALAVHRIGATKTSTLKSREYLAVGMPFISDCNDTLKSKDADFCLQVPADDTAININELVKFYFGLLQKETKEQLSSRIRAYAERNVTMEKAMSAIIEWLINGNM